MAVDFEQARAFFLRGVAACEAGRLPEAERDFAAALSMAPGRPSVLSNLGAVRLKLGRAQEALELLREALQHEPENPETLGHCGTALAELGRTGEALAHFDRALAVDPRPPALWTLRGNALRELGRGPEAAQSFREALARGGDTELLGYYLAGLEAGAPPPRAPAHYVEALFDGYAAQFDAHLVQTLHYDAPQVLIARLAAAGRRWRNALDLGCGTGLCGPLLRALADRVTGVDLSANMLEKARGTGAYDALVQADVVAFLAQASESFDLVVAADVFIYVGALDEVFALLAQRMPAGAGFCFTVEASSGPELELRSSLRYAHSEAGLRRLAQQHGFRIAALEQRPVRQEQRVPIAGLFAWLEKS
ncbi:tetratricopeptide repeat protein [Ramlibacter alkalitolerans]|uniref:Tetratricopeptide repeat protein n=1 Tax=Ramlibacter alkalitolerans TaxID=2039631 RepID=A0ABS1JVX0_9BURK|nr:tetratricopeptide repeat protein [Ramlibacter alkalitolerans]MBL0428352.1 tetratricopeptide repeat protein [Ramlibacter alkalitolerans]